MALAIAPRAAGAQDSFPLPRTTFGTIGLVEMPSSRMAPDGELSVSAAVFRNTQRYNFGFQALPWLDISFRYSGLQHFDRQFSTYYDRSYGLKIRLFKEGEYRPAISIGVNDLVGTGIYGGEYVVATKRVFDDFDATLGLGWGRLGSTSTLPNPLGYLFHSFKTRKAISTTGQADFGQMFHGPRIGLFGGVVWRTPVPHLSLVAEYSSDRYLREAASGNFKPRSRLNIGANYQLLDTLNLGVDWLYGESVGFTLSVAMDPTKDSYPTRIAPKVPEPAIRPAKEQMQALEELLQQGHPRKATSTLAAAHLGPAIAIDRFADSLIQADGKVRDVQLHGTTLVVLTASTTPAADACRDYAALAAAYLRDVQSITLKDAGDHAFHCTVQPLPEQAWQGAALLPRTNMVVPAVATIADTPSALPTVADADAPDQPSSPASDSPELSRSAIETRIRRDIAAQSLSVIALKLSTSDITLYYENLRYRSEADAIGRITRVLMRDAPPDVEYFHLVAMVDGMPVQKYTIMRSPMERIFAQHAGPPEIAKAVSIQPVPLTTPVLDNDRVVSFPRVSWAIFPIMRESFFDPDLPVRFAFQAGFRGKVELTPGLSLESEFDANIWNNFANGRLSNSALPHVRSDYVEYYKHGANGIAQLEATYHFRLAPTVFGLVKGGYLESMFGGFGGEVLWRPENSRLALGGDLYEVWQRQFDRLFGFQSYHVTTGHVTMYYASPWYGLNFRVMAGKYLAGDVGATFAITRRFDTGVEIGAFATFTNVPFKKFGEGSFDKGIIIRIPLDWALPVSTQSEFRLDLRPLTRDGGQRLEGDTTLYDMTNRTDLREFETHIQAIAKP